jgi:hypothetical protein
VGDQAGYLRTNISSFVAANPPVDSVNKTNIFFVRDLPNVTVRELVHFGMGMFFKAAVHGWRGMNESRIIPPDKALLQTSESDTLWTPRCARAGCEGQCQLSAA